MKLIRCAIVLIGSIVPSILLAIVLIVTTANVIARTVFQTSFSAANELAIVAFSLAVWFGIIGASASGQLIGVSFFTSRLTLQWQRITHIISCLLVIAICGFVIQAAYAQVSTSHFTTFLALGWPKWIIPAGLMVSMGFFILIQLLEIHKITRNKKGGS